MPVLAFVFLQVQGVLKAQQQMVTRRRLEDPDRFASVFRSLVSHVNREVLVVAIDNLDRLPGPQALEVLGAVKTFLEPEAEAARTSTLRMALGGTELPKTRVVFVVAVDDHALRRHLSALAPRSAGDDIVGANRYADEYLRKFFNASTTLRPVLTGDLAAFIRGQLEPVFSRAQEPEEDLFFGGLPRLCEQLAQTTEMATVALRRNPRRVRQFAANLELQLRLIRQRETNRDGARPLIAPPISGHVAMVAKLVLLEEEWPVVYELLCKDESKLETWHEAARRGERPDDVTEESWTTLAPFLRTSHRVQSASLRAFVRLKRTVHELEVPDYDDFRRSVVSGESDRLGYELDPREYVTAATTSLTAHRVGLPPAHCFPG